MMRTGYNTIIVDKIAAPIDDRVSCSSHYVRGLEQNGNSVVVVVYGFLRSVFWLDISTLARSLLLNCLFRYVTMHILV